MRRLFWIALVALAACGGSDGPTGENIIIDVSFDGVVSCFAADVDTVTIDWSNNALPSATIPCDSAGGVSFQYPNVAFGTYSATITGFSQGNALYAGRGPIQVDPTLPNVFAFDVPLAQ